jgi:hypothetical protein
MRCSTLNPWTLFVLVGITFVVGCGVQSARESAKYSAPPASAATADFDSASGEVRFREGGEAAPAEGEAAGFFAEGKPAESRKIIYDAQLSLVVNDLSPLDNEIPNLVKQFGGFVADSSDNGNTGYQRTATWRVRIPMGGFDSFLSAAAKLGVTESRRITSQDVSEEFVDLEARITNEKRLEERIVKLLEDPDGKLKEVIEVERELARVRGSIEQMEGRLRYLTDRTDLTTVTITAREERDYVPPEAPTFANRIRSAWSDSLLGLRSFGENAAVAAVSVSPWLILAGVVLVPSAWLVRRRSAARRNGEPKA